MSILYLIRFFSNDLLTTPPHTCLNKSIVLYLYPCARPNVIYKFEKSINNIKEFAQSSTYSHQIVNQI